MRKIFSFFILAFFINLQIISASCDENQININTAFVEELDKIQGIGPIKAQAIIEGRPFVSLDDLDRVTGIGNITLNNIKSQGLACVDENDKKVIDENSSVEKKIKNKQKNLKEEIIEKNTAVDKEIIEMSFQEVIPETIKLVPQTIKTGENSSSKNRNVMYMLIGFCFLLAFLFLLKGRRYKNEFR
jgi:competence ComEA-like helix-hairpin-helix protein